MDPKDEFEPPVVSYAHKLSNSSMIPDRSVPALRPPNVFSPGDDFTLWSFRARSYLKEVPAAQYGQYLLSLLDDSAARQLLSTGTSIEAPPAALWEILDDLFNVRQPTLLQLERFRERKQLPGESVDQFMVSLRSLATKIYAPEDRIKTEEELLQQFILGVSHPGLKAELIRRSPDNIRDAIQLGRSYEATSALEPQLHALKLTTNSSPRQPSPRSWNNRPASRMNCPYCRRFGRRAQRCGHNPPIRPTGEPLTFCNSVPVISHISHSMPPLTMSGYLDNRPVRFLVDTGASCSVVGAREFWPRGRQPAASTKLITANGAPLQTAGTASFSVSIGQLCTHHQFYCAPVTWEAILGMDFLKKYKASIDFVSGQITFDNPCPPNSGFLSSVQHSNHWAQPLVDCSPAPPEAKVTKQTLTMR
ncbi:hypothetical protein CRM22_003628 [Opisthorchis felineus]|uniref:Peptidase A2 domain-containing protein n=1 Tax=Opisthorchis felineus TaxID=147828 RepID=A0A4S2M0C5_OPIFE|nr:hypothetical protein CRM22_003628 [Opisthorchis felineus]